MDSVHLTIHPLDAEAVRGPMATFGPLALPTLRVSANWAAAMLPPTFEEAVASLESLPLAYVEPDGSFVWAGAGPPPFQWEGMLHDRGERLSHVELLGHGGPAELTRLIEAVAGDLSRLMIQSVRHGLFFAATADG